MTSTVATLPIWARALAIVVGLISLGAAIVVFVFPGIALLTLVFLLGFALLFIGIDRLAAGITGHSFGWAPTGPVPPRDTSTGAAGPRPPS
jgi:uncharacterized membrane protein HdeD (DUF308 family)